MNAPPIGARWRPGVPPGVYEQLPDADPRPVLVRMDVAAFVGLAERGPVGEPVVVESWAQFLARFGRPGQGRRLPEAVFAYFANGGRTAVVVRALRSDAVTARFALPGLSVGGAPRIVAARDPGRWGHGIDVTVTVRQAAVGTRLTVGGIAAGAPVDQLRTARRAVVPPGTTLRLVDRVGGALTPRVAHVREIASADDGDTLFLDAPLFLAWSGTDAEDVRLQGARRLVLDVELHHRGHTERWTDAALHPAHRRFLLRLLDEGDGGDPSVLVTSGGWTALDVLAPGDLPSTWTARRLGTEAPVTAGDDRAALTRPQDVLAGGRAAIDLHDARHPSLPVTLVDVPDLAHVAAARLDAPTEPPAQVGACFEPCDRAVATVTPDRAADWPLLVYDGGVAALTDLQRQVVDWCEQGSPPAGAELSRRVAILAPPPGLTGGSLVAWRHRLASDRAAAYAPWLRVAPVADPLGQPLVLSPCAAVCGCIARVTRRSGAWHAPGNVPLHGAIGPYVDGVLPDPGFLHDTRVNAVLAWRGGLEVMGSRTTSTDPDWTHLSVRRLVDLLVLQLPFDAAWAPFEPNNPTLWDRLRLTVEQRLTGLFHRGAFAGATPGASFFVRCGPETTSAADLDEGRVVVLAGVAPSVPAEFVVFQLVLQSDGTARVEVPLA